MSDIDPTVFYDCLDMDMATAYIQHAGASEATTHVVSDLVRSGAYHMPAGVPEGGYTILRVTPIIAASDTLTVEPLEFGANVIAPDMTDWSREISEEIAAGNKRPSRFTMASTDIGKRLTNRAFDVLADVTDGIRLDAIGSVVEDMPSRMLGGIVTGGLFSPAPEEGVLGYAIPYWHRAVPNTLYTDQMLERIPRLVRKRLHDVLYNEDTMGGVALVKLFSKTVQLETVAINDNVNLGLPPKRFIE